MSRKTFKKIIVTEDLLKKVNKENLKLAKEFLRDKSARVSPLTIKGYSSDLDIFFVWNLLYNDNTLFVELRKINLSQFVSYCVEELRWKSARLNRVRSTLSSFSIFIEKFYDDIYPTFKNIVLKTIESSPNTPARIKTVLSDKQVEEILAYFSEKNPQIATWFALAISSGARFSELLRIDKETIANSVDVYDGLLLETPHIKSKGRGKDGMLQKKYIVKSLFIDHYEKWIVERDRIVKDSNLDHQSIFIKKNGEPVTDGTVRSWIRTISKYANEDVYAHSLRHFLVSYLVRKGLPQELIIGLLGWKSGGAMFDIYNDVEFTDRKWDELDNLK